jgi:hypothetical protein
VQLGASRLAGLRVHFGSTGVPDIAETWLTFARLCESIAPTAKEISSFTEIHWIG